MYMYICTYMQYIIYINAHICFSIHVHLRTCGTDARALKRGPSIATIYMYVLTLQEVNVLTLYVYCSGQVCLNELSVRERGWVG